jgi:hypothetical protein
MKTNADLVKELSLAISGHFDIKEFNEAHELDQQDEYSDNS